MTATLFCFGISESERERALQQHYVTKTFAHSFLFVILFLYNSLEWVWRRRRKHSRTSDDASHSITSTNEIESGTVVLDEHVHSVCHINVLAHFRVCLFLSFFFSLQKHLPSPVILYHNDDDYIIMTGRTSGTTKCQWCCQVGGQGGSEKGTFGQCCSTRRRSTRGGEKESHDQQQWGTQFGWFVECGSFQKEIVVPLRRSTISCQPTKKSYSTNPNLEKWTREIF